MKKTAVFALMFCIAAGLATSALALRWPDNMGRRVEAMGGATLAIEDETTALTTFNHQNIAGVMLNPRMDRIDIGAGYNSTYYEEVQTVSFGGGYSTKTTDETSTSGLELARPGAEYRGLTYWLDDNMAIRAGIEGLTYNADIKRTVVDTDPTGSTTTTSDDTFGASGLGIGGSFGYKLDAGLALGVGLSYKGAGGEPGDLEERFDFYGGGQTTKVEISLSNLDWGVGAAYLLPQVGGEKNSLTFGLSVHADDDFPDVGALASNNISASTLGDYSGVVTTEAALPFGAVTDTSTYTVSPMVVSGEAIYNLDKMLAAGLLFDYKMSSLNIKQEHTGYPSGTTADTDYKAADYSALGITPMVIVMIPAGEDLTITGGLKFSTWGSGTTDSFSLDPTTAAVSDTFQSAKDELSQSMFGIGAGIQAMGKQLQVGVQFETGGAKNDYTEYNVDGTISPQLDKDGVVVDTYSTEYSGSNIRLGAEFWVMPMLAVRAGYAILSITEVEGFYDSTTTPGTWEDLTTTTNRITIGAGLVLPQGLALDLLVRLDSTTADPETPNTDVTDQATSILLGAKIPI
ncbi:hypothetical protein JW933_04805 [candidate division FCPU426 bacterium]|nr:hypothetical protein [candidate division FCPU426 bacterium]